MGARRMRILPRQKIKLLTLFPSPSPILCRWNQWFCLLQILIFTTCFNHNGKSPLLASSSVSIKQKFGVGKEDGEIVKDNQKPCTENFSSLSCCRSSWETKEKFFFAQFRRQLLFVLFPAFYNRNDDNEEQKREAEEERSRKKFRKQIICTNRNKKRQPRRRKRNLYSAWTWTTVLTRLFSDSAELRNFTNSSRVVPAKISIDMTSRSFWFPRRGLRRKTIVKSCRGESSDRDFMQMPRAGRIVLMALFMLKYSFEKGSACFINYLSCDVRRRRSTTRVSGIRMDIFNFVAFTTHAQRFIFILEPFYQMEASQLGCRRGQRIKTHCQCGRGRKTVPERH